METLFVSGLARVACFVVLSAIRALLIWSSEDVFGYVLGACTMVTHPLATQTLVRLLALGMLLTWLDYWSEYVQDASTRGVTSCALPGKSGQGCCAEHVAYFGVAGNAVLHVAAGLDVSCVYF